jgi:hypothetical protein
MDSVRSNILNLQRQQALSRARVTPHKNRIAQMIGYHQLIANENFYTKSFSNAMNQGPVENPILGGFIVNSKSTSPELPM